MTYKVYIIAALALITSSCSFFNKKEDNPRGVLSAYISKSFAIKSVSDKSTLIEMTTGSVKETLENLSSESFKNYFIESKKEFGSLKIRDERKISDDQYSITYELSYTEKNPSSTVKDQINTDKIVNKKYATFVLENGKWLISEVKNIKTYIEHENEMSL